MNLNKLPKLKGRNEPDRRVGRGRSSGKGKFAGRGIKGQRVRNRLKLSRLQIFKQFPMPRGKREYAREWTVKPQVVKLADCTVFGEKSTIDRAALLEQGLINDNEERPVKILANGSLDKPLTFSGDLLFSKNARKKIEDAGGTITDQS